MDDYKPPTDILEVLQKIEFEEALEPDDPRRVDTREARGSGQTLDRLARKLGYSIEQNRFLPLKQKHILYFGHVGAGKTTELKFYASYLKDRGFFFPVEIDVPGILDRNNLQYADLLMAMANSLLEALSRENVAVPRSALNGLESWFTEKVETRTEVQEFSAEVKSGAKAEVGFPLLLNIFATFSAAFKANATYKEDLRRVIRNTFTQLALVFNDLIRGAENSLANRRSLPEVRVLFFIDGTDKLREEDRRRLFIEDVELLLSIDTLAVYTAPIALKYEGGLVGKLDSDLVLPMIKLYDATGVACEAGWRAMREILIRRADASLFQASEAIDRLVEESGGHPRELLRLLQICCEFADKYIDLDVVEKAVAQLASEYRRILEPDDYTLLTRVDVDPTDEGNDERVRRLLYCLALLEYNDGSWRRSHPVIRTLPGYKRAQTAL
jgi:hypothetical protein